MADHMEVAPRMWDKTIAATYTSKKKEDADTEEDDTVIEVAAKSGGAAVVAAATTAASSAIQDMSFFTRFKTYLMPALFVLCFIVVSYILWKYFTKYKNEPKKETPVIQASDLDEDPMAILASEDLHKYELDSDDEQSIPDTIKPHNKLYDIEEVSGEDEESDECEESEESDECEQDSSESEEEEFEEEESESEEEEFKSNEESGDDDKPDISKIEQYILEDTDDLPILEDDMFSITTYDSHVKMNSIEPTPAPKKKARKPKRITL